MVTGGYQPGPVYHLSEFPCFESLGVVALKGEPKSSLFKVDSFPGFQRVLVQTLRLCHPCQGQQGGHAGLLGTYAHIWFHSMGRDS